MYAWPATTKKKLQKSGCRGVVCGRCDDVNDGSFASFFARI